MSYPGESTVNTLIAGGLNYYGTKKTNKANKQMAREQMAFQDKSNREKMAFEERMSNTAYQRAMADMEAAGLNPILAYNQGGASTPPGAASAGASAVMQNELGTAVSSAIDARRAKAEVDNLRQQNEKLKAETDYTRKLERVALADIASKSASAQAVMLENEGRLIDAQINQSAVGPYLKMIERLSPIPLGPLFKMFK